MFIATPVALSGTDGAVRAAATQFCGFSVRETGGTNAATLRLFDNASAASGTLVASISLAAGGSLTVPYPIAVECKAGLYADFGGTGTIEGSVYLA